MATVSDVTIKYAARGAKAAQKADKGVRDSIKETAKTAREESGTISRWMQRHRGAILAIAAATTGAMMAIVKASPTLSAEMATIRLGFSLLAMQIGQDLAPAFRWLGDLALDLADAYRDLPDPLRTFISAAIGLTLVLGTLAGVVVGLHSLFAGTFVATLASSVAGALSTAASAVASFIAGSTALLALIGAIIGVFVVWILEITGVLDWIGGLGSAVRDIVGGPIANFIIALLTLTGIFPLLAVLGAAVIGFVRGGFSGAIEMAGRMLGILWQSIVNTFNNIANFLLNDALNMITGAVGSIVSGVISWFMDLANRLIGGSIIPDMIADIASYLKGAAVDLVLGGVGAITDAVVGDFDSLNPMDWGTDIASGFADGLTGSVDMVASAADSVVGAVTGAIDSLNPMDWGSDLAGEFSDGLNNASDGVVDTANDVADSIANAIGFDNTQNDRMARRWGSDLLEEFAAGAERERNNLRRSLGGATGELGEAMSATPAGTGGGGAGGGGQPIIRFERGAIINRGRNERPEVDQRNVTKEQGSAFDSRSNI
jgi:hypothetical protein